MKFQGFMKPQKLFLPGKVSEDAGAKMQRHSHQWSPLVSYYTLNSLLIFRKS
jgi:hypothetical protein